MNITLDEVANELLKHDNILIISHMNPDGDTLGSAFALYHALKKIGKHVKVDCSDDIPKDFIFLSDGYLTDNFKEDFVVTVDTAAKQLFGIKLDSYKNKVDISIDHHKSNELYAKKNYIDETATATCQMIYDVINSMNIEFDAQIADCIYTGITTDSGCYKYSNTSAKTHIIAAKMFEYGANYSFINKKLFDTKSKSQLIAEQNAISSLKYLFNDRVAIISITQKMIEDNNTQESDFVSVSSLPRMIEGIEIGITIKEKKDGTHKISVRTNDLYDASQICSMFGGGGHKKAAGCLIEQDYDKTFDMLISAIESIIV